MPHYDLPLADLRNHRCAAPPPADLDELLAARARPSRGPASPIRCSSRTRRPRTARSPSTTSRSPAPTAIRSRRGSCGPRGTTGQLPCRVTFIGYGGGRNLPLEHALYAGRRVRRVRDGLARAGRRVEGRAHARSRRRLLRPRAPGRADARRARPRDVLLPPAVRRRGAGRRDGRRAPAGRRRPDRGVRRVAGRRPVAGGGRAGAGARPPLPRRHPVPLRHRARDHARARRAVHGARRLPGAAHRPRGRRRAHPAVHRQRAAGTAHPLPDAHLVRPDGHDLPAVDGVRRLQRHHAPTRTSASSRSRGTRRRSRTRSAS